MDEQQNKLLILSRHHFHHRSFHVGETFFNLTEHYDCLRFLGSNGCSFSQLKMKTNIMTQFHDA